MRVFVSSFGTRGDVQPPVALGLALKLAGHSPSLCGPPNFQSWVQGNGLPYRSVGMDFQAYIARMGTDMVAALREFKSQVPAQFAGLESMVAETDAVAVASVHCAGRSLAGKHGVPYFYAMFSP